MSIELKQVTTVYVPLSEANEPPKDGSQFIIIHHYKNNIWSATYKYSDGRFYRYCGSDEYCNEAWAEEDLFMIRCKYPYTIITKEGTNDE